MAKQQPPRNLALRVARYWALGWTSKRIAEAVRTSSSNVRRMIQTAECQAELERLQSERFGRIVHAVSRAGLKSVRTLDKIRRGQGNGDGEVTKAASDLLRETDRLIGYRTKAAEPPASANAVTFVRIVEDSVQEAADGGPAPGSPPSSPSSPSEGSGPATP